MKSLRGIIVCFLILFCMIPVFAQSKESGDANDNKDRTPSGIPKNMESEYYYYNIQIEKIYNHSKGYVVVYRKGVNSMAKALIPFSWFSGPDGKAELIQMSSGTLWPYISAYYKDGEFDHLRLFVKRNWNHESWGLLPMTADLDKYFEDTEEFKPVF